jgi:hypothetical protein
MDASSALELLIELNPETIKHLDINNILAQVQ